MYETNMHDCKNKCHILQIIFVYLLKNKHEVKEKNRKRKHNRQIKMYGRKEKPEPWECPRKLALKGNHIYPCLKVKNTYPLPKTNVV